MKRASIAIAISTIISRLTGFLRVLVFTRFIGVGPISEAFNYSNNIPNQWFSVITGSLIVSLIPTLAAVEHKEGEARTQKFFGNLHNVTAVLSAVLTLLVFVFVDVIIKFITGYSGVTLELTIQFTRVVVFGFFSVALTQIFTGYLNFKDSFIIPALISAPANMLMIVFILIFKDNGDPLILAIGNMVSMILQAIILFIFVKRKGFRMSRSIDFKDPYLRSMVKASIPILTTAVLSQFVDIYIGKLVTSAHSTTVTMYATLIVSLVQSVFVTSITTTTYPKLAREVSNGSLSRVYAIVRSSIIHVALLTIPTTLAFIVFNTQISNIVFGMVLNDQQVLNTIATILSVQVLGLFFAGIIDIMNRLLIVHKMTKHSMVLSVLNVTLNAILATILFNTQLGVIGVVLANALSTIVVSVLYVLVCRKRKLFSVNRIMLK